MKNILLGSILILVFLPQMSFGAIQPPPPNSPPINPRQATCNQQVGQENTVFWAQQSQDRGAFIKANSQSIARHDQHFSAGLAIDMARRTGKPTAGLPTPPPDDPVFLAFQQKQQSDKVTFLAKMNQDMQNCLAGTNL